MSDFDRNAERAVGFEDADWILPSHEAAPVITPTFLRALDALTRPRIGQHINATGDAATSGDAPTAPPTPDG